MCKNRATCLRKIIEESIICSLKGEGEGEMIKKAVISGVLFSSFFLVGCNGEPEVVVLEDSENQENDADSSSELDFFRVGKWSNKIYYRANGTW